MDSGLPAVQPPTMNILTENQLYTELARLPFKNALCTVVHMAAPGTVFGTIHTSMSLQNDLV
jgi:hypothetical protein